VAQHQNNRQKRKTRKKPSTGQPSELTFLEHIYELRKRLFGVVLVLMVASAAGFQFKDALISAVMLPLHGQKLIYLTPGGGFSFIFTLCLYFGVLFTIPVIVYNVYKFLQPMMGKSSRRFLAVFMVLSTFLAVAGTLFGYYVTIPAALNFLSTFAGDTVTPSLTAESYLNFIVTYVLGLAALFQLPLLLYLFDHVNPLQPGTLSSTQNYVIIGATVLAAVITPTPDAFNMAIVAIPIIIVYEFGAVAVFIRHQLRKKEVELLTREQRVRRYGPSGDDEPLTSIIEELTKVPRLVLEPVPVPVPEQRQVPRQISQPAAITPSSQQSKPMPAQSFRTTDGFLAQPRSVPPRIAVPQRQVPQPAAATRQAPMRQFRSIDGFVA
jgi:sec-independent protein translocase protein TatC